MPTTVTGLIVWLTLLTLLACAIGALLVWWVWPEPPPPPPEVESPLRLLDTDEIDADAVDAAWRDSLPDVARDAYPSIRCPQCRLTSYNPHDIGSGWCGNCRDWTSPATADRPPRRPMPPPHLDHATPRAPREPDPPRYRRQPKEP
jgi:hypothetical protein